MKLVVRVGLSWRNQEERWKAIWQPALGSIAKDASNRLRNAGYEVAADGAVEVRKLRATPGQYVFDAIVEDIEEADVLIFDLTPRKAAAVATVKPTAEEGARLYQMFGCMACHSTDGTTEGKVGPSWKGLFGTDRDIAKGAKGTFKADETYLRESILNPSAKVVKGFEKFDTGMPIYAGILNDSQIDSLVLFIKSLK
jgi:cytochrome c2